MCWIWVLACIGAASLTIGIKGLWGAGLRLTRGTVLRGPLAKIISTICILFGLGCVGVIAWLFIQVAGHPSAQ